MRVECLDGGPDAFRQQSREIEISPWQDDQEFVTAPPDENVVRSYGPAQQIAHVAKELIARLVSERVVHVLEPIDVQQQATQGSLLSLRAGNFTGDLRFAAAPIRKTCQGVGCRELLEDPHLFGSRVADRSVRLGSRPLIRRQHAVDFHADFPAEDRQRLDLGGGQRQRCCVENAERRANASV